MNLRHLMTVAAAAGLCVAGAAPATAVEYPITRSAGTVDDATLAPGQAVSFCGSGYAPNVTVQISVDGSVVTTDTTDGSGSFCATVSINALGSHVITARGRGDDPNETQIDSATVRVSRAYGPGGGGGTGSGGGGTGGGGTGGGTGSGTGTGGTGTTEGGLPFTGAEVGALLGGAVALIGAGAGVRIVARRRRDSTA